MTHITVIQLLSRHICSQSRINIHSFSAKSHSQLSSKPYVQFTSFLVVILACLFTFTFLSMFANHLPIAMTTILDFTLWIVSQLFHYESQIQILFSLFIVLKEMMQIVFQTSPSDSSVTREIEYEAHNNKMTKKEIKINK